MIVQQCFCPFFKEYKKAVYRALFLTSDYNGNSKKQLAGQLEMHRYMLKL